MSQSRKWIFRLTAAAAAWLFAAGPSAAASDYLEGLAPGDPDYDLAVAMEAKGCTMTETEIFEFLRTHPASTGVGGIERVIKDLAHTGDLVWDGSGSYTLVGWGKCS